MHRQSTLKDIRCDLRRYEKKLPATTQKGQLQNSETQDPCKSLSTLGHWKATIEYHKTKDILHVMKVLGHRNINNTLVYTQLVDFGDDEYTVRVAHTIEEDKQLVEVEFEYVTEREKASRFTGSENDIEKVGRVR